MSTELNKVIVFDAYGTLLDLSSIDVLLTAIYGSLGKDIGMTWRQKQLEYSWLRTLMGSYQSFKVVTIEALRFATAYHNVDLSTEYEYMLIQNYDKLTVFEDVKSILNKLEKEHQLAVLSNANEQMLSTVLGNNNVLSKFDFVLSANAVQEFKPRATVYQYAVDKVKKTKNEITFISSNSWDISGAKFFGFHTVWINRKLMPFDNIGQKPDIMVSSLEELLITA